MTRMLLLAAIIGGAVSTASACEWQKSVEAKTDPTVVASISTPDQATTVSTDDADAKASAGPVVVEKKAE